MNIIVTGASRGIGKELVKLFAQEEGNTIVAVSRNKARLDALQAECEKYSSKSNVMPFPFDLNAGNIKGELIPVLIKAISKVDILVNNAGYLVNMPVEDLTSNDFDRLFGVNVKAVFMLIQALLPKFNKNAHVVNISSMGGFQGSAKFPGLSLYAASKGALAVLTECLAEEFRERDIKVNCLALGAVQTEMLAEAFPGYQAPVKPDEMADFIRKFALTGHHTFNGKILPVSLSTP
jgi:NAD(P)-dependent dehydrogenase (short-subunit alcohol dehydrogenase family)